MPEPDPEALDLDHLADLANLPLEDDEREDLREACHEVLEAFQLPDTDAEPPREARAARLGDEPEPWPEDECEAILDEAPRRDGRHVQT